MNASTITTYRADPLNGLLRVFLAKVRRAFELAGAPYINEALPPL